MREMCWRWWSRWRVAGQVLALNDGKSEITNLRSEIGSEERTVDFRVADFGFQIADFRLKTTRGTNYALPLTFLGRNSSERLPHNNSSLWPSRGAPRNRQL